MFGILGIARLSPRVWLQPLATSSRIVSLTGEVGHDTCREMTKQAPTELLVPPAIVMSEICKDAWF